MRHLIALVLCLAIASPSWAATVSGGGSSGGGGSASAAGSTGAVQTNNAGLLADSGCTSTASSGNVTCTSFVASIATFTSPRLGIPASVFLLNAASLPATAITGVNTAFPTLWSTPSSANLAAAITDETGTGLLVFGTKPVISLTNATAMPATGVTGFLPIANGGLGNIGVATDDMITVGDGTVWAGKTLPNCTDTTGNHLNYTQSSNSFSCGTSSSGGGGAASAAGASGAIQMANNSSALADSGCSVVAGSGISCPGGFVAGSSSVGVIQLQQGATGAGGSASKANLWFDTDGYLHTHLFGANPATMVTLDGAQTLTNKTYNVEGTGNLFTTADIWFIPAAGVNGTTAGPVFNLETASPAVANYATGTNNIVGTLDFADTTQLKAQFMRALPASWTGNVDARLQWFATPVSGSVVWYLQSGCIADGSAATGVTLNATAAAGTSVDPAKGTGNQLNVATMQNVPMTSCSAGDSAFFQLSRAPNAASDTMAGTARLLWLELTVRRAL